MKKLGLLGGLSWVSTIDYYRYINEGINARLGGLQFAECVIYSLNFGELQTHGWDDWERTHSILLRGCMHLKAAGAEALVLCANTAHALADEMQSATQLPVIHIADATAKEISSKALKTVGFLGTKFTMELAFFHDKLRASGIESLVPDFDDRTFVQHTLRNELGCGIVTPQTKHGYLDIIDRLIARGAEGIVLGCTEIPLLLSQSDVAVPVFDTTRIHSRAAVDYALGV